MEIKNLSQSKFFNLLWLDLEKNSYINLGDGSYIRIVWSFSNAVKTHNVSYILLKKNYNLEENDEEEKEPINIELIEKKKTEPYNDENAIDSK